MRRPARRPRPRSHQSGRQSAPGSCCGGKSRNRRLRARPSSRRGSSRKISLASTGASSRTPGMPAMPAAMRAAIAFDARAMSQPQPVFDIGQQLRRGEAHLRPYLAGAAQLHREPIGQLGREHDDRVAQGAAVLGRAERHDVDAGTPGRLGRAAAEPGHRIGESAPRPCAAAGRALSPPRRSRGPRRANRPCRDRSPGSG